MYRFKILPRVQGELPRVSIKKGQMWYTVNSDTLGPDGQGGQSKGQSPHLAESFPPACIERFDRTGFLPYTSVFVREAFTLSGTAPSGLESFSWKGNIFGPGTK